MKRQLLVTLVSAALGLASRVASAQDVSAAKALFEKGVADLQAGKFDAACPAIAESYKLDPRAGSLFTLAECFAQAGKTASAVARYEDYLSTFGRMSLADQAKQGGRDKTARERHDRLKPQVPLLTVRLESGAPAGTTVTRDGIALGSAAFGIALPVDPGTHTFVTQAPGGAPITETVTLADGDKKEVTLKLGKAAPLATPPPADAPAAPLAARAPTDEPPRPGNGRRTAGIVVAGVGGAGLLVGAIAGGLTLAKKSTITQNCTRATLLCANSAGENAVSSAQTTGLVSTLGFVVGGVALAGGVVLIATAPAAQRPANLALAWSGSRSGGSLGLTGRF